MPVELRKLTLNDKENLSDLYNGADRSFLSNRLPYSYTIECALWWLNLISGKDGKEGIYRGIWVDDSFVGVVSVDRKEDVFACDADISYLVKREFWSKGIATDAVKMACAIAFEELDIRRLTGMVYDANMASRKVLEKNGFEMEGVMRQAVEKNGMVYDLCIYGKYR